MTAAELRRLFPGFTKPLTDDDCTALLAATRPIHLDAREMAVAWREEASTLFFVTKGVLSIHVEEEGEDLILGQAGPGALVGEVGLLEPGPASATVQALEDTDALALERDAFETLCREQPSTASALLSALSRELVSRLRNSSRDIVRRIDDHRWMRAQATADRPGWRERIARLVRGGAA